MQWKQRKRGFRAHQRENRHRSKKNLDKIERSFEFPTEILLHIFSFVSGKDLLKCRAVSRRWNDAITWLHENDSVWRRHCETDFRYIWEEARIKTHPDMSWYHLYRSLSAWSSLAVAKEVRYEQYASPITGLSLHGDRDFAVHTRHSAELYNINTLDKVNGIDLPISRHFKLFAENECVYIGMSDRYNYLKVIKKANNPLHRLSKGIENVVRHLLVGHKLFYSTTKMELFVCETNTDTLESVFLQKCKDR